MRNGGGGAQNGKRRLFIYWDSGKPDGWGIRVVGRAPLRWPDRAAGASHRGPEVGQRLRCRYVYCNGNPA